MTKYESLQRLFIFRSMNMYRRTGFKDYLYLDLQISGHALCQRTNGLKTIYIFRFIYRLVNRLTSCKDYLQLNLYVECRYTQLTGPITKNDGLQRLSIFRSIDKWTGPMSKNEWF